MARPRQITDEQIDAAARETFLALGHRAPVALIASKLGVSHAALLQRAGSKDQLLLRALSPVPPRGALRSLPAAESPVQTLMARLGEPPPSRDRAARLVELLVQLNDVLADLLPGLIVLRARGLPTGPPPGVEAPTLVFRRLLGEWLVGTREISAPRAAALAEALLGAIEARCFNAHVGGESFVAEAPKALAARLVSALLPELGPLPRARRGAPRTKGKTR